MYVKNIITIYLLSSIIFLNCMITEDTRNPKIRIAAQEYNKAIALNRVPKDVAHYMFQIIVDTRNSIGDNIRTCLVLSQICSQLNDGNYFIKLLKKHEDTDKNKLFEAILSTINDLNYTSRRKPLKLLIRSGANPDIGRHGLLERAVSYNDMNMLSLLSCYKANFNRNYFSLGSPLFFHAETVEVA